MASAVHTELNAIVTDENDLPLLDFYQSLQEIINRQSNFSDFYHLEVSQVPTELHYERDINTGYLTDVSEVVTGDVTGGRETAKSSVSLKRDPTPAAISNVKGNPTNLPFKPPTLDKLRVHEDEVELGQDDNLLFDLVRLHNNIPGLNPSDGLNFEPLSEEIKKLLEFTEEDNADLMNYINDEVTTSVQSSNFKQLDNQVELGFDFGTQDESLEKELDDVMMIKDIDTAKSLISNEFVEKLDVNEKMASFKELFPEPAFEYPFELDTFQKQALLCLEKHENVFVAAHTSAGKTVVAEYAIGMAIRRNLTRVIYTSPVKALSNQKFRDFQQTFGEEQVGIITGDVQIRTEAPCLIMTTEILLHMLYNGSDVIRDLEWVIFDEVHYCNDPERGHVWEEVFIMLPEHVGLVLLSATVNNVEQYADWLGRTRNKKTYVMATTKRPVPLEHYLFTGKGTRGKEQKFLFIDSGSNFLKTGYNDAMEAKKETTKPHEKRFGKKQMGFQAEKNFYISCIRHLEKEDQLPVILFTLNRKRCDQNAGILAQAMDLTTANEKGIIHKYIKKSLINLKATDKAIPQVQNVIEMLKKGFGVHHSGILPILKEITEILFQDGLVRVLFATETFAMGVNMPARTVAFDSIEKHDGICRRNLLPSEYIQMAGRAGRRGKDKTGTVLVLVKQDLPEQSELFLMALGKPAPLVSQFRLTYSMILNLIRARHHLNIESVMERSFIEHDKQITFQKSVEMQKFLQKRIDAFDGDKCPKDLIEFCDRFMDYKDTLNYVAEELFQALKDKRMLTAGRLMLFEADFDPFAVGVFLEQKRGARNGQGEITLLAVSVNELLNGGPEVTKARIVDVNVASVHLVYSQTINVNFITVLRERGYDAHEKVSTAEALVELFEFLGRSEHELDLRTVSGLFFLKSVDPLRDLKLNSLAFAEKYDRVVFSRTTLLSFECLGDENFTEKFNIFKQRSQLKRELDQVKYDLSPNSMKYLPEYNQRLRVLEQLGYVNEQGYLEMKGRVACLFTDHELVLTELLLSNELSALEVEEVAAIMSGFVFQVKLSGDAQPNLTPNLANAKKAIEEIAEHVGKTQQACGLKEACADFVEALKFGLVEVAHQWAKGTPFNEVVQYTDVQEGIIVRTIQRLDEILSDVKQAAKMLGDPSLSSRMEAASKSIRRDIVFAASLYTQSEKEANQFVDETE
ncbi:Helicase SKI2W [Halotydeus destructor]|nr:Helicase SKI2W [Halotydeus destructor]